MTGRINTEPQVNKKTTQILKQNCIKAYFYQNLVFSALNHVINKREKEQRRTTKKQLLCRSHHIVKSASLILLKNYKLVLTNRTTHITEVSSLFVMPFECYDCQNGFCFDELFYNKMYQITLKLYCIDIRNCYSNVQSLLCHPQRYSELYILYSQTKCLFSAADVTRAGRMFSLHNC